MLLKASKCNVNVLALVCVVAPTIHLLVMTSSGNTLTREKFAEDEDF